MDSSIRKVKLENISASGALFTTEYKLQEGTNLNMEIELPQVGKIPLPARVVRSEKEEGSLNRYKIAVEFRKKERREHSRLEVNYLAWYRKIDEFGETDYKVVTINDISAGGVSFVAEDRLSPGEEIDLEVELPGAGKAPMKAEVVRADRSKRNTNFFEIGVKFIAEKVYQPSINYIDDLVERQMTMVA